MTCWLACRREAEARRLAELEARKMRELEQLRMIEEQKRRAEEQREQARYPAGSVTGLT